MVYCVRCGAKNEGDAVACSVCGAPLYLPSKGGPIGHAGRESLRGAGKPIPGRGLRRGCLGIPRGSSVIGLAIGLIIVLAGLSLLLKELYQITIPWWPIAVMILGIFIIIGAIFGPRRR